MLCDGSISQLSSFIAWSFRLQYVMFGWRSASWQNTLVKHVCRRLTAATSFFTHLLWFIGGLCWCNRRSVVSDLIELHLHSIWRNKITLTVTSLSVLVSFCHFCGLRYQYRGVLGISFVPYLALSEIAIRFLIVKLNTVLCCFTAYWPHGILGFSLTGLCFPCPP